MTLNFYSANKAKYRNKFHVEAAYYKETLLNNPRAYLPRVHFKYDHYIAMSRPGRKLGVGGWGRGTGKGGNRGLENYSSVMRNPRRNCRKERGASRGTAETQLSLPMEFLPSTHSQPYFLYSFHSNLRFFSYPHSYFLLSLHFLSMILR